MAGIAVPGIIAAISSATVKNMMMRLMRSTAFLAARHVMQAP